MRALSTRVRVSSASLKNASVLAGGTMLYFKVLLEGLAAMPEADTDLRARLEAEAATKGWPAMHARLAEVDGKPAAREAKEKEQREAKEGTTPKAGAGDEAGKPPATKGGNIKVGP